MALSTRLYYQIYTGIDIDFTYANVPTIIWTTVEFNIGIICASLPGVRVVLKKCFPPLSTDMQQTAHSTMRYSQYLRRSPSTNSNKVGSSRGTWDTFSDGTETTGRRTVTPNTRRMLTPDIRASVIGLVEVMRVDIGFEKRGSGNDEIYEIGREEDCIAL